MAKAPAKKTNKKEVAKEPTVPTSIQEAQQAQMPTNDVPFTESQMAVVQKMIEDTKASQSNGGAISVYGKRDPRVITHVKVSVFDGKFVIGFKDLQNNPYVNIPKYSSVKTDINRKLNNQPFVTLLLSNDGVEIEEREVSLIDFMDSRGRVELEVLKMEKKENIKDHGLLGRPGGSFASGLNDEGGTLSKQSIKAESKELIMKFYVQPEGFAKAIELREDFLA